MNRRTFLEQASAGWAAGTAASLTASAAAAGAGPENPDTLSFGVVTDVHYADIPPRRQRPCGDSLKKLKQAMGTFQARPLAFLIELGDLIDEDPAKLRDREYLQDARKVLEGFPGPRYYVLGNHCVWVLGKEAFLEGCGMERSWYTFESGSYHGVVLDACFTRDEAPYRPGEFDWKDSWIPREQLEWLREDLARARERTVLVFVHQNLQDETRPCGVKNAAEVRRVLEEAGNVAAVFQGHEHQGAYARIGGIHYITLRGLIEGSELESNAYAIVHLQGRQGLKVEGFGKQPNLEIRPGA